MDGLSRCINCHGDLHPGDAEGGGHCANQCPSNFLGSLQISCCGKSVIEVHILSLFFYFILAV